MNFLSLKPTIHPLLSAYTKPKFSNSNPPLAQQMLKKRTRPNSLPISLKSRQNKPDFKSLTKPCSVAEKLQYLVSEFNSLTQPIDRVKRLLHYASLLPEFDESSCVESNRVTGCTAQVWLEVAMDEDGAMRFKVDSDSEITKGFCFCLFWLLDGAMADEVLEFRVDDLGSMNVGILPSRASSRVNTWHNVLTGMQARTKALVLERCGN